MTEDYTLDLLIEMPLEEFADLIQKFGKYRYKNPRGSAKAIRSSYRLGVMAKEIRSLEKLIKDLDKAINDLVVILAEYQYLTSIPGIGSVYATEILAEIGSI